MKILLIEDDEVDRKAIKRALNKSSLETGIQEATDSKSANELLNSSSFDCILLDYRLPDIDGLAFAKELMEKNGKTGTPIVMLTGEGNEMVAVEAMKSGIQDYLPKSSINASSLSRAINHALEITTLHRQIEEMNKAFERMALTDSLTELGNRNLFTDRLSILIATSRRSKAQFSLLMMDLNKFKQVNDTHGHEAGDEVLRQVGKRLMVLGRDADMFFRLGGDEFAAIVTTGVTREGLSIMAERIKDSIEVPMKFNSLKFNIGISIGIVLFPEHGDDEKKLLHLSDLAMYDAKRGQLGHLIAPAPDPSP